MIIHKNLSILLLSAAFIAALVSSCDRGHKVTFVNQTDQEIIVYWNKFKGPPITRGTTQDDLVVLVGSTHRVEARDLSGNVIYQKKFHEDELDQLNWTIIIAPEKLR